MRVVALLLLLFISACSDKIDYETRLIKLPVGMVVTCADDSGNQLNQEDCVSKSGIKTAWILDAGSRGLSILDITTKLHYDSDSFVPGFNTVPVGGAPIAIRADLQNVYSLLTVDDVSKGPSLAVLPLSNLGKSWDFIRQPLTCDVKDLALGKVADAPVVLVLGTCGAHSKIWALPVADLGDVDLEGVDTWDIPGIALKMETSKDGLSAYVTSIGGDSDAIFGDILSKVDLAGTTVDSVAIGDAGRLTGKAYDFEGERTVSRLRGRPAISPDGSIVYLPLGEPGAIAVFDGDLERLDVNATGEDGVGNKYLEELGFKDILLSSPAVAVVFVTIEESLRAIATMENGTFVRIVVEPTEEFLVTHVLEPAEEQGTSAASSISTRYNGEWFSSAYLNRSDLPSFGLAEIKVLSDEKKSYYGIEFVSEPKEMLNETWVVTNEGVIPGTRRVGTLEFDNPDAGVVQLVDEDADFCALGVLDSDSSSIGIGDIVVLTPNLPVDCGLVKGEFLEYRIAKVEKTRLTLEPAYLSVPLPEPGCFEGPVLFEVRVALGWSVVGSKSGFLHPRVSEGDACVDAANVNPLFNSRAYEPYPKELGGRVSSCPIREADPQFDIDVWNAALFENPIFKFRIVPGCRAGRDFLPETVPTARDTQLKFQVVSGFVSKGQSLTGLSSGDLAVFGTTIYGVDTGNGLLFEIDADKVEVVSTSY